MIAINQAIKNLVADMKKKLQPSIGYNLRPDVRKGLINWQITDGPVVGILTYESDPEYFSDETVDNDLTLTIYGIAKANNDQYNNDQDIIALAEDLLTYFENDCIYKEEIDRTSPVKFEGPYSTGDGLVWAFTFNVKYIYNVSKTDIND